MKKVPKFIPAKPSKKAIKKSRASAEPKATKGKAMTVFHHNKEEEQGASAAAEPNGPGGPPKREMTPAEAEEVLDRLHYCKKHGKKMEADEHGAWHCEIDDKEQAAEEEKEAKEAWAVYSKAHPELAKK